MPFDNICKFICKHYPQQYIAWLFDELVSSPIAILESELSVEPIHADSLIFLQTKDLIFHFEFQLDVCDSVPVFDIRMLDYWVRLYREYRTPIEQIVILLKDTPANRKLKGYFQCGRTSHGYRVIRIWEIDPETLLKNKALLPLACLAKTDNPTDLLNRVAEEIEKIDNRSEKVLLSSCTQLMAGIRFSKKDIQKVFKEGIMRESVVYQEILQEGMQEGIQKGMQKGMQKGKKEEALLLISQLLQRRFGEIDPKLYKQIEKLSVSKLESLFTALFDFHDCNDIKAWLRNNKTS